MRAPFKFSKTTVSMHFAEVTDRDLNIPGPKTDAVVATEWRIIYTRPDGSQKIHLVYETEVEADEAMDNIKAQADALAQDN